MKRASIGVSRSLTAGIVIIVIVIAGAAAALVATRSASPTVTSVTSVVSTVTATPSASTVTSVSATTATVTTSATVTTTALSTVTPTATGTAEGVLPTWKPTSTNVQTLSIDSWIWPIDDLNQLYAVSELPWPNWLTYTVYQPLVTMNQTAEYNTGTIQYLPGLAANWTVSSDGRTYTFNLRPNVHFSNGDPLNAYQVWTEMYGFYYLSGNSSTWLESYNFFNMAPVKFGPSTINLLTKSGLANPSQQALQLMQDSSWPIYVTGPNQIVFRLNAPFQWFPGTLVVFDGLIYDTNFLLQHGGFGTASTFNSYFNQNPIPGTGPYTVTQVSENAFVKFQQNPNYWGATLTKAEIAAQPLWDPGHAANVIIYYKPDNLARFSDLRDNSVQISAIEPSAWNLVTSNPQFNYMTLPSWAGEVALLGLNANLYPTNITAVRQAVVHAINYTDLYAKAYQGQMTPYVGPEYPLWKDFYDLGSFSPYQYNVTQSEQILKQANIDVSKFPTFSFKVQAGCEDCINVAQVIQADLAQIGINVNIEVISSSAYYAPLGNYQTNVKNADQIGQLAFVNSGFGWSPATVTPADYWVTFVNSGSVWGDWPAYANPVVQKCVDSFTSTSNVAQIQALCKAAQQQIYNDAPYAWIGLFKLWLPPGGSLVWKSTTVTGFMVDPVWNGQSTEPIFNTVTFG